MIFWSEKSKERKKKSSLVRSLFLLLNVDLLSLSLCACACVFALTTTINLGEDSASFPLLFHLLFSCILFSTSSTYYFPLSFCAFCLPIVLPLRICLTACLPTYLPTRMSICPSSSVCLEIILICYLLLVIKTNIIT